MKRLFCGEGVVLAFLLFMCSFGLHSAYASSPFPQIELTAQASGLARPVAVTHAADGTERLFITQQGGQIVIFYGTEILSQSFLDISTLVSCCGEQGLLSVAFHPNYLINGLFFVNYTNTSGDTVIEQYTASAGNPNEAVPDSGLVVLTIDQNRDSLLNNGEPREAPPCRKVRKP